MGGAFVALADDANAVYWNPAGIGQLKRYEVSFMHNMWIQDITYNYFSFINPLKIGALGVSFYHVRYGEIQGYDETGTVTEKLEPYDLSGVLSLGVKILDRKNNVLFLGANVKYILEDLEEKKADTYAADAGLIYKMPFAVPLSIGFMVQNLGPKVKFFEEDESLPVNFKTGMVMKLFDENLNLALDLTVPSEDDIYINTGFEYRFLNFIFMRMGYRSKQVLDTGMRYGVGITGRNLFLDYSFVPYGELERETHRISMSLRFGKKYGYSHIENEVEKQFEQAKRHFYQGQLLTAYRQLKEVLALVPGHEGAQEYLARTQVKVENGMISQEIDKHISLGEKYFKNGEIASAQAEFDLVLSFDSENVAAQEYQKKISKRFKEIVDSMLSRGKTFYEKGDYNLALKEMEKILSFEPEHSESKKYIALIKEKQEEIEKIKSVQKAEVCVKKGENLYKNKRLKAALKQFNEAYKLDPENISIKTRISNVETEMNKVEKERKTRLAKEYYMQGVDFYESNKLNSAIGKFEEALKCNPKHKEAKEYLKKVNTKLEQINKEKAGEYNKKGLIEYAGGNVEKAIGIWEKALACDPENEEVRSNLERAKKELRK